MKAWNKFCCTLATLALLLLMGSMAAPAFAYGAEPAPEPEETEPPVTVLDENSGPLTPEGNLTLVDDYHTTYSDGSGQQFITLVSKSGAYFYLVIDRAADGDQTVHFMNLVDEADLLALMLKRRRRSRRNWRSSRPRKKPKRQPKKRPRQKVRRRILTSLVLPANSWVL